MLVNSRVLWHHNTKLFGQEHEGLIDIVIDIQLRLKVVLGLLVIYYNTSMGELSIRSIKLIDLLSHDVVRVHSDKRRTDGDAHVLELNPVLHALVVLCFQFSAHLYDWVGFVVPRSVDLVDHGLWASRFLGESIVVLLEPVLDVALLDQLSDDIMSLGWLGRSEAALRQGLDSCLQGVLGGSVISDSGISRDTSAGVGNKHLTLLDHLGEELDLLLEDLWLVLELGLAEGDVVITLSGNLIGFEGHLRCFPVRVSERAVENLTVFWSKSGLDWSSIELALLSWDFAFLNWNFALFLW